MMIVSVRLLAVAFVTLAVSGATAQELEPGAYSPAPAGFNIVVVADSYNSGDLAFDPAGPIDDASASIHVGALGYVRTFGLAGRGANVSIVLPYARGDLEGLYLGEPQSVHRSGWGDPRLRFSMILSGMPAMTPKEFMTFKPGTIVGTSLVVAPPLGKYDNTKLINIGSNRWSFKPEIGISRALGHWTLEGQAGVWLFTDNTDFRQGGTRKQDPIGSLQAHVIYTFRPRMWLAVDANYFTGGETSINGGPKTGLQKNFRAGLTFAMPINRRQSLKFNYSRGARTTIGADFETFGLAWQYGWMDKR